MDGVAQLVRASDCGSEGRGFESHHPPIAVLGPYWPALFGQSNPDDFDLGPHAAVTHIKATIRRCFFAE